MSKQTYTPLPPEVIKSIKVGDVIERMLAFCIPCYLIVQKVTEDRIKAGWEFSRKTGLEIDEDIPVTVSYIRRVLTEEQKQFVRDNPEKQLPYE